MLVGIVTAMFTLTAPALSAQTQPQEQQAQNEPMDSEEEQAMQQWLMRIPDDPGELLRNKFRYQAQQQMFQQLQNPSPPPTNQRTW